MLPADLPAQLAFPMALGNSKVLVSARYPSSALLESGSIGGESFLQESHRRRPDYLQTRAGGGTRIQRAEPRAVSRDLQTDIQCDPPGRL